MLALLSRYAGRPLTIDEFVFRSERETGERNRAIASLMRQAAMLDGDTDEILDVYFSQCSVLVTCRDLALMAATLANGGVQPVTGERVLPQQYVADVLTVMHSCGMYNYAGQWSYEVGVPAKSSVSGSIIGAVPGQMGLVAFSPPLDKVGNSVRAMAAFKSIAREVDMHVFRARSRGGDVIRRELSGDTVRSKRRRTKREAAILDENGHRIRIIEAQGRLNFSSTERLLRRVSEVAMQADALILDLRRVHSADSAAQTLLLSFVDQARQEKRRLLLADAQAGGTLKQLQAQMEECPDKRTVAIFPDCDAALEICEECLLADAGDATTQTPLSLAQIDLFQGLTRTDLKPLEHLARPLVFMAGQTILKEGDPAKLLFVIAQGTASVRLRLSGKDEGNTIRVAAFGPGATLGEMALLAGGTRSADVVADDRVICYGFTIDELRGLENSAPRVINTILLNLARELADRIRRANDEIRALKH
jgi:glutaminase